MEIMHFHIAHTNLILGLVLFDAKRPSKQFFSHVGTEPPLPGYFQYFSFYSFFFFGGGGVNMSCSRTQHGDRSGARTPDL